MIFVRPFGDHLFAASSAIGMVMICQHPLGLESAEASHALFGKEGVPYSSQGCLEFPIRMRLSEAHDIAVLRALCATGGRRKEAAVLLGCTRRSLSHWVKRA